ncbi:MAG: hypothetical protein RLZZ344_1138 [Pseudomonadota bacterium]
MTIRQFIAASVLSGAALAAMTVQAAEPIEVIRPPQNINVGMV